MLPDVPESELQITYARSSGPGGQNVNKRETKAVIHWHVNNSAAFSEEQKQLIHATLPNRISQEGFLVVDAEGERSRDQNRANAITVLQRLVRKAIMPKIKRIATKPTRSSQRKRLETKTLRSRLKRSRRLMDE
jgi:ribosome-associated protein